MNTAIIQIIVRTNDTQKEKDGSDDKNHSQFEQYKKEKRRKKNDDAGV